MKKLLIVAWLLSACAVTTKSSFHYELEPQSKGSDDASRAIVGIEYDPRSDLATLSNISDKGVEIRLDSLTAVFDSWALNVPCDPVGTRFSRN